MNGIDWEKRTSKPMEDITIDDKLTVIISVLDQIQVSIKPVPDTCKTVERHKIYFKGLWVLVSMIGIPVLILVIGWIFDILKRG